MRTRDYDRGPPEGESLADFELLVRPDRERLTLQISDRHRAVGGVPEAAVEVDVEAARQRAARLVELVNHICNAGVVRSAERDAWVQQAQLLHDLLVPPSLRGFLRGAVEGTLWLRLRGWAIDLPWEWLHDGEGAWCERYAIGREVPVPPGANYIAAPVLKSPAHTVVIADPAGDLPAARAEVDAVHQVLRSVGLRPRTQAGSILSDDLRVMLRAADILHVAAHVEPPTGPDAGATGPGIRCADGLVVAADLQAMGGTTPFPALVVLNGCRSHPMAPALLSSGAGTVVATLTEVGDQAASDVAVALYQALARGTGVGESLRVARQAASDPLLAAPYVLYGDPAGDLVEAFPSQRGGEEGREPDGVGAWVAVCVLDDSTTSGEDDAGGALRAELAEALERLGLDPQPVGPDTLVARVGLERYGDRFGDAALEIARGVIEGGFGHTVAQWQGDRSLSVGVGLCGGGPRARARAAWLASQSRPGAALADGRLKALCRGQDARWARQPGALEGDRPVWRVSFDQTEPPPETRLLAREAALASLVEGLEDAVESGLPQLTVLVGPAGIGKSALLEAYAGRLREAGVSVVVGEAGVLGDFRVDGSGGRSGCIQRMVLGSLGASGSLGEKTWQQAELLRDREGTLVWIIDGAHDLDAAFESELTALLDQLDRAQLQIVVSLRSDSVEGKARAERLATRAASGLSRLAPLRPADARQLLRQRLGVDSLPDELEPLVEQAAGNPLLLIESLEQLRREGAFRKPGRGLIVDPMGMESRSPAPLEEALVASRVAVLPDAVRAVVEAVAVLRGEVPVEELESLPSVDPNAVTEAARMGWIRLRSEPVWGGIEPRASMRDPLVLRVLPGLLPSSRTRPVHDAALAWLEARLSPPSVRAWHALRSSHPLQAVVPLWEEAEAHQAEADWEGVLEALNPLERLLATAPEHDLPLGTPAANSIRALRDAAEHVLAADGDPTAVTALDMASISTVFEPLAIHRLGRYRLVKVLGSGRSGVTYLAESEGPEGFRRAMALKVLHARLSASGSFLAAFQREARIAARLNHPNIVAVTELGRDGDLWYLTMEHVDGCSARTLLRANPGGVPADIALQLAAGVAAGLAHAHKQTDDRGRPNPVVHRDICPENVLVSAAGVPRLYDFGMARAEDTVGPPTETGALRGRAGYAAPERIQGDAVGPGADLWSLGVLLFELLTGEVIFGGRTILDVLDAVCAGDISPALRRVEALDAELAVWLGRLLERDPGARFPDAQALAEALEAMARRLSRFDEGPTRRLAQLVAAAG